jgi:GT2 family glycosyltransferase
MRNSAALKIGIVTFNNSQNQLGQLQRSVDLATEKIRGKSVAVQSYVIDNGEESIWAKSEVDIAKFASCGNVGFGNAMNVLMEAAFSDQRTSWFLCLNPDGALHYKALDELLSSSATYPNALIEARQFPEELQKSYDPGTLETPWASGACLLIPRIIYETIGGFDSNLFMYLEDIDLSWRARSAGFSVKFAPNALFGHAVLNRKPNPIIEQILLLSGRYLAYKWKNRKYINWTERQLIERGFFVSRSALPLIPEPSSDVSGINTAIAHFEYNFVFAPSRW